MGFFSRVRSTISRITRPAYKAGEKAGATARKVTEPIRRAGETVGGTIRTTVTGGGGGGRTGVSGVSGGGTVSTTTSAAPSQAPSAAPSSNQVITPAAPKPTASQIKPAETPKLINVYTDPATGEKIPVYDQTIPRVAEPYTPPATVAAKLREEARKARLKKETSFSGKFEKGATIFVASAGQPFAQTFDLGKEFVKSPVTTTEALATGVGGFATRTGKFFVGKAPSPLAGVGAYAERDPFGFSSRVVGEVAFFRAGSTAILKGSQVGKAGYAKSVERLTGTYKPVKLGEAVTLPGGKLGAVKPGTTREFITTTGGQAVDIITGKIKPTGIGGKEVIELIQPGKKGGAYGYSVAEQYFRIGQPGPVVTSAKSLVKPFSSTIKVVGRKGSPGLYGTPPLAGTGYARISRLPLGQKAATFADITFGEVGFRTPKAQIVSFFEGKGFKGIGTTPGEVETIAPVGTKFSVQRIGSTVISGERVGLFSATLKKAAPTITKIPGATTKTITGTRSFLGKVTKATGSTGVSQAGFVSPVSGVVQAFRGFGPGLFSKQPPLRTSATTTSVSELPPVISVGPFVPIGPRPGPARGSGSGTPSGKPSGGISRLPTTPIIRPPVKPPVRPPARPPIRPPIRPVARPFIPSLFKKSPKARRPTSLFRPTVSRRPSLAALGLNIQAPKRATGEFTAFPLRPILKKKKKKRKKR